MLRAIQEIQPRWVVGENVYGIVSWNDGLVFNEVQADLEAEGYEVQPFILPACAINAPHRRDRVWFIANAMRGRYVRKPETSQPNHAQEREVHQDIRQHGNTIWSETQRCSTTNTNSCDTGLQRHELISPLKLREWKCDESGKSITELYKNTNWQQFPTQSPICGGDDGLPTELHGITFPKWRNESIKAYGNAIVPQVAMQIFKAIQQYELTTQP
jgi:DNA (cytosine-5)-methyltransferase 1